MREATFICHLGLGDLILCSGIAVWLLEKYDKVYYPTSVQHENSVRSFFFLEPRVEVYVANGYPYPYKGLQLKGDLIKTGFYGTESDYRNNGDYSCMSHSLSVDNSISFAENFYKQVDAPYSVRWDYCPIQKVVDRFYKPRIVGQVGQYCFVHDDDRFSIDERRISPLRLPMMRPLANDSSILSHVPLMMNAMRIDVIDSSFLNLIESINTGYIPLYYHRYARPVRKDLYENGRWNDVDCPTRKNWNVLR